MSDLNINSAINSTITKGDATQVITPNIRYNV
ncbi:hypothetical protein F-S17_0290 [Faustovirus]|nr:hypothetical protein F-LCD7_0295 [Faustovirus]QJX72062.1 hypothetical protein F-M6_0299 [Faustovirus]QJX72556.1 hypothetical protein F-S17_0290 [Faustovirus]QJX73052.1 hypothetical protein F-VV57_0291 [Faustovirus]QJX73559.1 hypothetical protein F-VV63_0293 [Faustovirus]